MGNFLLLILGIAMLTCLVMIIFVRTELTGQTKIRTAKPGIFLKRTMRIIAFTRDVESEHGEKFSGDKYTWRILYGSKRKAHIRIKKPIQIEADHDSGITIIPKDKADSGLWQISLN